MTEEIFQAFSVPFSFPIVFTRNLFDPANLVFRDTVSRLEPEKRHRVFVVADENVVAACPRLIPSIEDYFGAHFEALVLAGTPTSVIGGEEAKNDFRHFTRLLEQLNCRGIDRQSFMAVIGGGAVLDLACFVGAVAHRGVRTIRIPTTVLSQSDSGVGVKNGINWFGKKNFAGTFVPPFAVLNDLAFIETLRPRDKIAGLAEAVKVSLIRDHAFFEYLESHADALAAAEIGELAYQIRRTAELHSRHIGTSGDPFESGSARPLDFGHWSAHKLESLSTHRIRHGEAVAIGVALDSVYSVKAGYLPPERGERILHLLEHLGFTLWDDLLLLRGSGGRECVVLQGLEEFREHLGGELTVTLLRDIGAGFEVHEMDRDMILQSIGVLHDRHAGRLAGGTPFRSALVNR